MVVVGRAREGPAAAPPARGVEALEVACAVGDVAGRKGGEWGLEARRACGAGRRGDGIGSGGYSAGGGKWKWERARVWEVYPLQQGGD